LLYPGRVNSLVAESGGAKTWAALVVAAQELGAGQRVVFVDFEDQPEGIVGRLLDLGVDPRVIIDRFRYVSPQEPFSADAQLRLLSLLTADQPSLVVLDSVGESMALDGVKPNDDDHVARWYRRLPRQMADTGPAVVVLDHVTKNSDGRGLYAIGSQRKRAAISGASYLLETVVEFGQGQLGKANLVVAKDRGGAYIRATTAAELTLDATAPTGIRARFDAPDGGETGRAEFRPTRLMEQVSRYVEAHPGASGSQIDKAKLGKADYVRKATAILVTDGWLSVEKSGTALRHTSLRSFRDGETA
jgi:hypothetical protein